MEDRLTNIERGLSFDDILLKQKEGVISSRDEADTSVQLTDDIELEVPLMSANMDTVTEAEMAQAMANNGGMGILHRFMEPTEQRNNIAKVDGNVGCSIGICDDYVHKIEMYVDAGVDLITFDVPHAYMSSVKDIVADIKDRFPEQDLMVGNIANKQAAKDFEELGVDIIKVGIGPGSCCITREVTGVGCPQVTAVNNVYEVVDDMSIVADGGIRKPGDFSKALMVGADCAMMGSMFASCEESSGEEVVFEGDVYKRIRGMASQEAREAAGKSTDKATEGKAGLVEKDGTVEDRMDEFKQGLKSSISYCGGSNVQEARKSAEFVRTSPSTRLRNGTHNIEEK